MEIKKSYEGFDLRTWGERERERVVICEVQS
jgi:hypothetical protein